MDRRSFFRRVTNSPFKSYLFPPYFKKTEDFSNCLNCTTKDCLNACNEKIIEIINEKPVLNFKNSGCTFCDECARACKEGVLHTQYKKNKINAEMLINAKKCIAWNQTICFSCQDVCEQSAIIYKGMFNPVIDLEKCSACGFCVGVCPADAVETKILRI